MRAQTVKSPTAATTVSDTLDSTWPPDQSPGAIRKVALPSSGGGEGRAGLLVPFEFLVGLDGLHRHGEFDHAVGLLRVRVESPAAPMELHVVWRCRAHHSRRDIGLDRRSVPRPGRSGLGAVGTIRTPDQLTDRRGVPVLVVSGPILADRSLVLDPTPPRLVGVAPRKV